MVNRVHTTYGNKLRVRVCGICCQDEAILLINHKNLVSGDFWSPPGGGIELGETAEICLKREFREETGLEIHIERFLFNYEFINMPLHAIELFFEVQVVGGHLTIGQDPEMEDDQMIKRVEFLPFEKVERMDRNNLHSLFRHLSNPSEIRDLRGYIKP